MKWVRCEIKKNKSRYSLYIEESRWNTDDHNHNMAPTDKQQFQRTHKYTAESKWRLYRNNWVFCIRLLITMFMFDVKSYQREREANVKKNTAIAVCYILFSIRWFFLYIVVDSTVSFDSVFYFLCGISFSVEFMSFFAV